jgi:hypothetical protein
MYFAVFPAVRSQCSQSVKFKISQNGVLEMFPSGTFRMYPPLPTMQCTTFGKFWVNFGNTASTFWETGKLGNILNVLAVFPKFPRILPKVVHMVGRGQYILNVPLGNISAHCSGFILGFTDWEHCDRTLGTHKVLFK